MGCCDSSTQLGSHGGICIVGGGVVEGDAAGCEGIGLTSVVAERAEGTSAAKAVARCGETYVVAEATTDKAARLVTPVASVGRDAEGGAGNSVGARNVLEIDDLRTMNSPTTEKRSAARWLLLLFVRFYQIFFSPFLGGACKFYPSCSRYAQEAIEVHGARRGAWLALQRLGRCRPFTKGGFDPVPEVMHGEVSPTDLTSTNGAFGRGTSAAKAAARDRETNVVAKATTHKPMTHKAASEKPTARKIMPAYRMLERRDADWLRTAREERAQ